MSNKIFYILDKCRVFVKYEMRAGKGNVDRCSGTHHKKWPVGASFFTTMLALDKSDC